jgi:WD40 repeat protein
MIYNSDHFLDLRSIISCGTKILWLLPISQTVLARSGANNKVLICSHISDEVLNTLRGHTDRVMSIEFCAGDEVLVAGSEDRTVRVWNIAAEKEIAVLEH